MIATQGIGLTGAHRVGKSTLARAFSDKHGIPFIPTTATETWQRLGLDPAQKHPFITRMMVQEEILKDCSALYASQREVFITDRTPIDFLAYTYADINGVIADDERAALDGYVDRCYAALNLHFRLLLVVQPGIPLELAPGKAALEPAYIEHLSHLVRGLVSDERVNAANFFIRRVDLSLDTRIKALEWCLRKSDERLMQVIAIERETMAMH